ncbi:MAG TPA: hypothetical protein PLY61_08940, partial [Anaerohalosphaeraceae bacterium]|nr:hypothetical protein [Anaerohalosphaeraceae bacterium]HRT86919.1 hypothetical protein [Anaerohalosphaeraceae bacterium]
RAVTLGVLFVLTLVRLRAVTLGVLFVLTLVRLRAVGRVLVAAFGEVRFALRRGLALLPVLLLLFPAICDSP